jgi:hypothetical protein
MFTPAELDNLDHRIKYLMVQAELIEREILPIEHGYYGDEPPDFMSPQKNAARQLWSAVRHTYTAKAAFDTHDYTSAKSHAEFAKSLLFPGWATWLAVNAEQAQAEAVAAKQAHRDADRKRIEPAIDKRKSRRNQRDVRAEAIVARLYAEHTAIPKRRDVSERLRAELSNRVTGKSLLAERTAEKYASRAIVKLKQKLKKS